ncbi:MAG: glycosyltransferase [Clostridia bacterium]|nr:glycosyltransferase [Clostridia bacterium]
MESSGEMKVAVLIPCYNEAQTIAGVVADFRRVLPSAGIWVYDNNSTDGTGEIARKAGAFVRREYRQGKGFVVRSMFAEIDADVYVLVDGDDTYPAEAAPALIAAVAEGRADMAVGDRLTNGTYREQNKRRFHDLGNGLVRGAINLLFRAGIRDVMTGYRAFSRRFVKNFPVMTGGFEIETEMTLHALDKRFAVEQIPIDYRDRPEGSASKLHTFRDGARVIRTLLSIFKDYKPLSFYGGLALLFFLLGLAAGVPVLGEYAKTAYITHVPLAILASALEIMALLALSSGLVLDTLVKADKRNYELSLLRGADASGTGGKD